VFGGVSEPVQSISKASVGYGKGVPARDTAPETSLKKPLPLVHFGRLTNEHAKKEVFRFLKLRLFMRFPVLFLVSLYILLSFERTLCMEQKTAYYSKNTVKYIRRCIDLVETYHRHLPRPTSFSGALEVYKTLIDLQEKNFWMRILIPDTKIMLQDQKREIEAMVCQSGRKEFQEKVANYRKLGQKKSSFKNVDIKLALSILELYYLALTIMPYLIDKCFSIMAILPYNTTEEFLSLKECDSLLRTFLQKSLTEDDKIVPAKANLCDVYGCYNKIICVVDMISKNFSTVVFFAESCPELFTIDLETIKGHWEEIKMCLDHPAIKTANSYYFSFSTRFIEFRYYEVTPIKGIYLLADVAQTFWKTFNFLKEILPESNISRAHTYPVQSAYAVLKKALETILPNYQATSERQVNIKTELVGISPMIFSKDYDTSINSIANLCPVIDFTLPIPSVMDSIFHPPIEKIQSNLFNYILEFVDSAVSHIHSNDKLVDGSLRTCATFVPYFGTQLKQTLNRAFDNSRQQPFNTDCVFFLYLTAKFPSLENLPSHDYETFSRIFHCIANLCLHKLSENSSASFVEKICKNVDRLLDYALKYRLSILRIDTILAYLDTNVLMRLNFNTIERTQFKHAYSYSKFLKNFSIDTMAANILMQDVSPDITFLKDLSIEVAVFNYWISNKLLSFKNLFAIDSGRLQCDIAVEDLQIVKKKFDMSKISWLQVASIFKSAFDRVALDFYASFQNFIGDLRNLGVVRQDFVYPGNLDDRPRILQKFLQFNACLDALNLTKSDYTKWHKELANLKMQYDKLFLISKISSELYTDMALPSASTVKSLKCSYPPKNQSKNTYNNYVRNNAVNAAALLLDSPSIIPTMQFKPLQDFMEAQRDAYVHDALELLAQ
jgi:hypothetical protein